MRHIKVIFAIYVGIYLILPGCLCQIAGAFGFAREGLPQRHSHPEFAAETAVGLPCHCHEVTTKSVESPVADSAAPEAILSQVEPVQAGFDGNLKGALDAPFSGRAPPRAATAPSITHRCFTGVFLI